MANLICSNCKTENPPENLFCQVCGTSLKGIKPAAGEKTVMAARGKTDVPPPPMPTPVPQEKVTAVPPVILAPPPPPPPVAPPPQYLGTPISKLGVRIDNWSDMIEGKAEKTGEISDIFVKEIEQAKIEGVKITSSNLTSGTGAPRKYHLVHNGKGATVAVRFVPFGKDLFYSWDIFARRTINWMVIGILVGAVFLLALLSAILTWVNGSFFYGVLNFFSNFVNLLLVPGLALLLAGKLFKDDIWGFYLNDLDDFALDDANALGILVDNMVSKAIE